MWLFRNKVHFILVVILLLILNIVLRYFTSFNLYEWLNILLIRIIYFDILRFKSILIFLYPGVTFSYFHYNNIQLGNNVFINKFSHISASSTSTIIIKDNCMFGPSVTIIAGTHDTTGDYLKRAEVIPNTIIIEKNVWIGVGVKIIGNVTIGENSIIGAGSVVVKSIPKNNIAVGVPAKVIKHIKD